MRVESEETQDHVREANDMDQEEDEEISFVPSAISVPQKPLFRCDNHCSEKTFGFWQLASVVIKEGEESYAANLCQKCCNESLKAKGNEPLTRWQLWRKRRIVEDFGNDGKTQYVREMWEYVLPRKSKSKKVSTAGRRRKACRKWQLESPAREYLEHEKCCNDTDCMHRMMKQGFLALKSGECEELDKHFQEGSESLGMCL